MKNILLLFLCIISFNAIHAKVTWTLSSDGTLTISGTGDMPDYDYPNYSPWNSQRDKIKKVVIKDGVTSIGGYAFYRCSGLTSLTIPNSVTSIGDVAFSGCSGLTSVTIPNSVTRIGNYAFHGCSGLTSLSIPNSVTSIGDVAFSGCSGLTSLTIPNSVTSIGDRAFYDCSGLTSITVEKGNTYYDSRDNCNAIIATKSNTLICGCKNTDIPNSVTSIGGSAFYGCSGLTSLTIPNSVTRIGNYAFHGCSGLTSLSIPNSVTSIGGSAFYGCSGLTSLTIPNSVTSIGESAFFGCPGLTSVTIPNSVTSIGESAFLNCSGLTSVTIPNSVTSIGGYAFGGTKWYDNQPDGVVYAGKVLYAYKGTMPSNTKIEIKEGTTEIAERAFENCTGLISLTIPNSVTSIGSSAFYGCSSLTSVTIPNSVTSIGSEAFCDCSCLSSLTIPNSVTSIGYSAFSGCFCLTSLTIPNSVTSIGEYAFYNCSGLTSLSIPNSVTSIGVFTFYGCSGLTSVTIPNSVTSIGEDAFSGCSCLTSLTIPNTVTYIGGYAFGRCNSLTFITCEANTPPSCGYNCFYNVYNTIPVYVPAKSVDAYKKADGWKDFTNIQAIVSYTLTDGAFYTNNSQINGRDISYTRTFNNTAWQALYIPFSLNFNDWKDEFEVAYINGVRQLDKNDDGIIDETIMDVIKIKSGSTSPNMPYLIKAKKTGEKTFSVSNATLYPAEENSVDCSTTIAKYTFTGTYNAIPSATMIANGYYAMGGGDLIQSDGSNDLKPYRWYMKVESRNPSYNASNAAKTITINVIDEEGETTTGVEELQMTNCKSPVYDLNGRKVNENNLKPGIYVKNGKKFVVK